MGSEGSLVDSMSPRMFLASPAVAGVFADHDGRLRRELTTRGLPTAVAVVSDERRRLLGLAAEHDEQEQLLPRRVTVRGAHESRTDRIPRVLAFSAAAHRVSRLEVLRAVSSALAARVDLDLLAMVDVDEQVAQCLLLEGELTAELQALEEVVAQRRSAVLGVTDREEQRQAADGPSHADVVADLVRRAERMAEMARTSAERSRGVVSPVGGS